MSGIFVTSDPHFGHDLVSRQRGFATSDEHDALLQRRWRARVGEEDEVYLLGDLCVSARLLEQTLAIIDALPGRKHLVFGNHDAGHPMHKNWAKTHAAYDDVFTTTGTLATLTVRKQRVLLAHFPYDADAHSARYAPWHPLDAGLPLVHGHTHASTQESVSHAGTPQLHVGLDAWDLTPVPFGRLDQWLARHETLPPDA